jgi:hypothetical protein
MTKPPEKNQSRAQQKKRAADDATSIVILPALSDFAKGRRRLCLKSAEGYFASRNHKDRPQIAVTHSSKLV